MAEAAFTTLLKSWRKQRGFSQLALALASDVSQRHLSFLESGRSQPSREMILRLGTVLEIPFRDQNTLLTAAGFAPVFVESDLSAPELAPIRQALDFMLHQQEPYPAIVMDRYWNQLESNQAAQRLWAYLIKPEQLMNCCSASGQVNLMKAMLHPDGLRPIVTNWKTVAAVSIRRVHREAVAAGENSLSELLFQEMLQLPDVKTLWQSNDYEAWQVPLLTVKFEKAGTTLAFFSTLATLGTPYDITLQELRIECLFPADEITAEKMHGLAKAQINE
ncbi:transcriptional regulator [Leptolyngbya sp. Heron Island J]|uniref:helix-turn-helix domain-containing protein n=1 Tax=Leptolyngbya sp. Heron Island J TaxID=1385935 RepID=UPI0003B9C42B|nr:helix-turn-helix transcriptional regulator [Leptolyngbya sp. Heron Island J]ESA38356.1 transcriptional regulator [Leptolyngbya sp. Heron Island J]